MIFELGAAKAKVTLLDFNSYVLEERHKNAADFLLMSFNTFEEIDLLQEIENSSKAKSPSLSQSADSSYPKSADFSPPFDSALSQSADFSYPKSADFSPPFDSNLSQSADFSYPKSTSQSAETASPSINSAHPSPPNSFAPTRSPIKRLVQLSLDDNCTVFCGIKTVTAGACALSVAVAHKGILCDIASRTASADDNYAACDTLKIYNTVFGRIALLIDSDGTHDYLWKKIIPADFVFCFTLCDRLGCDIRALALKNNLPCIITSNSSTMLVRR